MGDPAWMYWLGGSAAAGCLSLFLFPNSLISAFENFGRFCVQYLRVLAFLFFPALLLSLYLFNRTILHSFMGSADEHSCYFFAKCILQGKWWLTPHPLSEFFNVVHVGNRDGKWFSVYPPGWPALFALGLKFQILEWVNPFLASASLFFFYQTAKKVFGTAEAVLGIFCIATAPFFVFTSAAYFSHPTCLLVLSIYLWAYGNWLRESSGQSRIIWISIAAAAAGYGLMTRYLTMASFVAPVMIFHGLQLFKRREKWSLSHTLFVLILAGSFFLLLCHNFIVTGDFFEAPNHYDKRWERLGFKGDHSLVIGLTAVWNRILYLADWAPPIWIFLAFIFMFRSLRQPEPMEVRFLRFAFWCPALAYVFYYSWGGNQFGPRYYYEGFPFLALAFSDGFLKSWRCGGIKAKKILAGILIFSLVNAGFQFAKQGSFYDVAYAQRRALYDAAEQTLSEPAIVFIRGFLGDKLVLAQEDAVRNDPALSAHILYAHDLGEKNRLLMEAYPERQYYRGTYDRKNKKAVLERL